MASIIKVDTLQKPDGSTPTAADLGIDVAGTVLQAHTFEDTSTVQTSSGTWLVVGDFVSITRTQPNSKFVIQLNANIGMTGITSGSADADNYSITLSRNNTAISTTARTSMSGYGLEGNVYGFTASDVPFVGAGTYYTRYDSTYKTLAFTDIPSGDVGTTFTYGVALLNSGGAGLVSYNRSWTNTGSGGVSTIHILEIAQ